MTDKHNSAEKSAQTKWITVGTIGLFFFISGWVQIDSKPNCIQNENWGEPFRKVTINSSADGKKQSAYFYATHCKIPKPLIISLHTWSGDFQQNDPLSTTVVAKDWNYIHPDFRGMNNTSEACGSPMAMSDIDDAISFALKNGNVDSTNIHMIGVSGGGFATLLAYMKSTHNIRSFSAWVPISNLEEWYYESLGRKNNYARDISLVTTGDTIGLNASEARLRSPVLMSTPINKRMNSKLYLYCGIHDGYNGSVPISHSINFYNKVVDDFDKQAIGSKVSEEMQRLLLSRCYFTGHKVEKRLGDREIILQYDYLEKVQLTIFEGGHEMVESAALEHIPSLNIMTIGDSNGEMPEGWVNQLKKLRFNDLIVNHSISGNTIGFDNLNSEKLNSLKNIQSYISSTLSISGKIDIIIILLGTNDCKAIFKDQFNEVPGNLDKLISIIKKNSYENSNIPDIFIVSPPPMGPDSVLNEKFYGGLKRLTVLIEQIKKVSAKENCHFIDIYTPLSLVFPFVSNDGVHLINEGQYLIAEIINRSINFRRY